MFSKKEEFRSRYKPAGPLPSLGTVPAAEMVVHTIMSLIRRWEDSELTPSLGYT